MGIEGVENLKGDDVKEGAVAPIPKDRPTDQEVKDRQESELAAEREEHNRKTGGGAYPLSTEK